MDIGGGSDAPSGASSGVWPMCRRADTVFVLVVVVVLVVAAACKREELKVANSRSMKWRLFNGLRSVFCSCALCGDYDGNGVTSSVDLYNL